MCILNECTGTLVCMLLRVVLPVLLLFTIGTLYWRYIKKSNP